MTTINEQFQTMRKTGAELAQARANHQISYERMWAILGPILTRHQKVIGSAFEAAGHQDAYQDHFGYVDGGKLQSMTISQRYLEISVADTFRGETEMHEFKLPRAYLECDPEAQIASDLAHYERLFERISRRTQQREEVETRAANLRELARLSEIFKDDPEATRVLASNQPNA